MKTTIPPPADRRATIRASYLEMILTDNCNLRCSYCWQKNKTTHDMSQGTAFAAIDLLLGGSDPQPELTVLFFGGEPMLRFDLIEQVVTYADEQALLRSKKISWTMTTNGTLLTEDKARRLAERRVKYLLSLDGGAGQNDLARRHPDGRGTFEELAAKLPGLKRYQPWQGVKMTVIPQCAADLAASVEYLWRLGINQFVLGHAHGTRWDDWHLAAYERAMLDLVELYLRKRREKAAFRMTFFEEDEPGKTVSRDWWGCGAGRGRLCADSYGDLYGCSKLATITGRRKGLLPLGTVAQGVTERENLRRLVDGSIGCRPKCCACELRADCTGGCPAINFAETGDIHRPGDVSCRLSAIARRVHVYMKRRLTEDLSEAPSCAHSG
jgi:uncharacterized protein